MDTSYQQVKDCTNAAYTYLQNKTDKNSVLLQKHLQALCTVGDLEFFEPSSSETVELYMCLENSLVEAEARSTVAGKALALLTHVCDSETIREALRDDIKIIPVLSNFLVNSKLSKDNLLKTLNLLTITTYKVKIEYLEGWVLQLVPFLASLVTEGTVGEETPVVALQILANLCRSNPSVVECVHRLPNNKALLTTLFCMKNAKMYIRLLAVEMMSFVDSVLSETIFSSNEIIDMIFMVAIEGFEENRRAWLQLAADVFEEFVAVPALEAVFKKYQNYSKHLQLLLSRLAPGTPELLAEALLDFVCRLVKYNHQDIRTLHEAVFIKVSKWLQCPGCGWTGVRLVKELLGNAATNTLTSHTLDTFVEVMKVSLTSKEECTTMTASKLQHITAILGLVDHISTHNEALHLKLAWKLEPSLFSNLVERTAVFGSHGLGGGQGGGGGGDGVVVSREKVLPDSTGYHSTSLSGVSSVSRCEVELSVKKTLSKAVILMLVVMKGLGAVKSEHLAEFRKMMRKPEVMRHLMWGGQSGSPHYATKAWDVISNGTLNNKCLEALVEATGESGWGGSHSRMSGTHPHLAPSPLPAHTEEKVDTLIARLLGTVKNMEIKDCGLTDVIDMYEYRLASLAHSEQSLEKALMKADLQNRQSSLQLLRTNVQNDHLRSLLAKWELNIQKVRVEKTKLQETVTDIEQSSRHFKDKLLNENENLENKIQDLKKELMGLECRAKVSEEKNARLLHQLNNKVEEMKKQQTILHKEQDKGAKLSKQVQKLEKELEQSSRSVETLKKEIESLENNKTQLSQENSELELVVKSKEAALAVKGEELEEALDKLNKMLEIQNMIHDISSRRVIK